MVSPAPDPITLEVHDASSAPGWLADVRDVYAEVYAEPPYFEGPSEVARFAQLWTRYTTRHGFRLVLGKTDGQVVGIAFGHYLPTGTDWWDGALTPLPDTVTDEHGARTFAVIELAVRKPYRRRGVADAMHRQLLADLSVERITLLVRPEPETAPARAAYASWGYRKIGQIRPGDDAPVYDSMMQPYPPQ